MLYNNYNDNNIAFIKGYIIATLGEIVTSARVSESELDAANKVIERYVEQQIEQSLVSDIEKGNKKNELKLWAESFIQGMKKRLRESGRLSISTRLF